MELVVESVSKRYGQHWALRDISLRSGPGMLGLVGPNGAGKTTLMRIIATLLVQTAGLVSWRGYDTLRHGAEVRRRLGYLPQDFGLYPELTGRQFLLFIAELKGLTGREARWRVDELVEALNLVQDTDRRVGTYSGGMKQRLGIAQALLNDPELLIVDEATAGLDPEERVRFRSLLADLTANRLIIFSTHIIADLETVATRLVLLKAGRVIADTTPVELVSETRGKVWMVTTDPIQAAQLQNKHHVSGLLHYGGEVTLRVISLDRPSEGATPIEPSLEDAYLLKMFS